MDSISSTSEISATTRNELALANLIKYISFEFHKDEEGFNLKNCRNKFSRMYKEKYTKYRDINFIHTDPEYVSDDEIEGSRVNLQAVLRGDPNTSLGKQVVERIELLFELPSGCLYTPIPRKQTVYVLVNCNGKDANTLQDVISRNNAKWHIVDECTMVSGSADLFLRLHGTSIELKEFLTNDIYDFEDVEIQGTTTLFSFDNSLWRRFSVKRHQDYKPSKPTWLSDRSS